MPEVDFPVSPGTWEPHHVYLIGKHCQSGICYALAWWSKATTGIFVFPAWLWASPGKHQNSIFLSSTSVPLKTANRSLLWKKPERYFAQSGEETDLDLILSSELVKSWD